MIPRSPFSDLLADRKGFGLRSQDVHPETGAVGQYPSDINSAMRLPANWEDVWRRG
jgi:hypothetical protein